MCGVRRAFHSCLNSFPLSWKMLTGFELDCRVFFHIFSKSAASGVVITRTTPELPAVTGTPLCQMKCKRGMLGVQN